MDDTQGNTNGAAVKINTAQALGTVRGLEKFFSNASFVLGAFSDYRPPSVDSVYDAITESGPARDISWDGWSPYSGGKRRVGRVVDAREQTSISVFATDNKGGYGQSAFPGDQPEPEGNTYRLPEAERAQIEELLRKAAERAMRGVFR